MRRVCWCVFLLESEQFYIRILDVDDDEQTLVFGDLISSPGSVTGWRV